jgi:hypothetical protein
VCLVSLNRWVLGVMLAAASLSLAPDARASHLGYGPGFNGSGYGLVARYGASPSYGVYRPYDFYGPAYGYNGYYPRYRRFPVPFGGYYPRYRRFYRSGFCF